MIVMPRLAGSSGTVLRVVPVSAAFSAAFIAVLGQVGLGIYVLFSGVQAHVALTHQIIAVLVWVLILRARFQAGYPVADKIKGA